MKKTLCFLLAALLLLSAGCGVKDTSPAESAAPETTAPTTEAPTEPVTEAPTEAPTEPLPECVDARIMVDDVPAIHEFLHYDDIVYIVDTFDQDHYIVQTRSCYGIMEKQLVYPVAAEPYEAWTGYAKSNAPLYADYQLIRKPVLELEKNTELPIVAELNDCYVVQFESFIRYIPKEDVSKSYIQSSYSGGGSSGGSSSGGSSGGSSSGESSGGADGGDISLSFGGIVTLSNVTPTEVTPGPAKVLVDYAPVILAFFNQGNTVSLVVEEGFAPSWEGYYTIYVDGFYAHLRQTFACREGHDDYATWEGFAAKGALLFDNYLLKGDGEKLSTNTAIVALWDCDDCMVVIVDGEVGYMQKDHISETEVSTGGGYSGGGSSSGGSSSGGGSSGGSSGGGSSSGGEWTPPVL